MSTEITEARTIHQWFVMEGLAIPYGNLYRDAIVRGGRAYVNAHGARPGNASGDADDYVGFKSQWGSVIAAVERGNRGMDPMKWDTFCDVYKIGGVSLPRGAEFISAVRRGAALYIDEQGKPPGQKSGDAEPYVGFASTWARIDSVLRSGSHGVPPCGGLCAFLAQAGMRTAREAFSMAGLRSAIRKEYEETGEMPTVLTMPRWAGWCSRTGISFATIRDDVLGLSWRKVAHGRAHRAHAKSAAEKRCKSERGTVSWWMGKREISAAELAKAVGISSASISLYESGKCAPRPRVRSSIAAALGLKPEQIKWDAK